MPRGRPRKVPEIASTSSPAPSSLSPTEQASNVRSLRGNNPKTLKGVLISPAVRSTRTSLSATDTPATSTTRENSADYETPATSTSGTPAASIRLKRKAVTASKAEPLSTTQESKAGAGKAKGKSKMNENTRGDEEIARVLQAEEYDAGPSPGKVDRKGKAKAIVIDSDNHEDELSDPLSVTSVSHSEVPDTDEDEPLSKRRKTNAANKKPQGSDKKNTGAAYSTATRSRKTSNKGSKIHQDAEILIDSDDDDDVLSEPESVHEEDESELSYFDGESEDDLSEVPSEEPNAAGAAAAASFTIRDGQSRRARRRHQGPQLGYVERQRLQLEKAHPEILTMWDNLKALPKIETVADAQPGTITRQLKKFQLEGLHWMREQEKTQWKGGLLGDEMGMGKTIQAVSLIMSDYPAKDPTLVVCPPVALMQWSSEISDYTDGKLKVLVYHGTNSKVKHLSIKDLKKYDVIMISYSGLESIHRKETKGWTRGEHIVKEDSAIHAIDFHRIILDEAHCIKQRTTGVAKACFALKGTYKWCLSGTPVQNRIGEFFSLLRFLGVTPFANYFCKVCPCSSLHWSLNKQYRCTLCNHRGLDHISVFNQEILNPIIQQSEEDFNRKEAFGKLRLLTDRIMLRRMKRDYTSSMELPPKEIVIHNEFFGEIEKDFANSIMGQSNRQFDTYVSRGVMLDNYANIFGLIMQMRQVSDHPDMITRKHAQGGQNVLVCNICDEPAEDAIRSRCRHEFCRACVKDFVRTCESSGATPDCPRCHIALSIDFEQPEIEQDEENVKQSSIINRIKMENWTSSTKIEMLVYDLWKLRSPKQTTKSIVFSQFTSMLQLVEWRLRRAGFSTVMLDGSMSPAQRQKSIEYFMNNTEVEVFLVSLKAGGVALNLTEASHVFIIDPWWNPAAEWQSADRCHRIGQRRPCLITRMVVEDSIESRIVLLQEKKAHMINSTVNNDEVAMEKLTPQDMQFLFRGT